MSLCNVTKNRTSMVVYIKGLSQCSLYLVKIMEYLLSLLRRLAKKKSTFVDNTIPTLL